MSQPKEQLADRLRTVLTAEINTFLAQPSEGEVEFQQAIETLRKMAAEARDQVISRAMLKTAKEVEDGKPDNAAGRRQEAAQALLAAVQGLGLPLALKGAPEAKKPAAAGTRMSRAEMLGLTEKLLPLLSAKKPASIDTLAQQVGVSMAAVRAALQRLKREDKAVAAGRGLAAGWKKP